MQQHNNIKSFRTILNMRRNIRRKGTRFIPKAVKSLHHLFLISLITLTALWDTLLVFEVANEVVNSGFVSRSGGRNFTRQGGLPTLLIVSTSNQVDCTKELIASLEKADDKSFDVLFIDDHSRDDTVEFLESKNAWFITKEKPYGLTHSWNMAYQIFLESSYKNIIIANNDVLFPSNSIDTATMFLELYPFMAGLSTAKGVGHCPEQAFEKHFSNSTELVNSAQDKRFCQDVQNELTRRRIKRGYIDAYILNDRKFNGFLFGMRKPEVQKFSFSSSYLFDPSLIMVGQEDELFVRIEKANVTRYLCLDAFFYHMKSVTVKASGFIAGSSDETRNDLSIYHGEPPKVVGLAVSNAVKNPFAGDIFTALEFGGAIKETFGWEVRLLNEGPEWYDLQTVDIVVAFLDHYDISKIFSSKKGLLTVAWVRNWFHRWIQRDSFVSYNIVFSSSLYGKHWLLNNSLADTIEVLRLATNASRFFPQPTNLSQIDWLFPGSYWNQERIIMKIGIESLPYKGAIYGYGWEKVPQFINIAHPAVRYHDLPNIYASTLVVVDDANHVAGPWGSINSRVFDALASGALPISNNRIGIREIFGYEVPHYSDGQSFLSALKGVLDNKEATKTKIEELRNSVLKRHTYMTRAKEFVYFMKKRVGEGLEGSLPPPTLSRAPKVCFLVHTNSENIHGHLVTISTLINAIHKKVNGKIFLMDEQDSSTAFSLALRTNTLTGKKYTSVINVPYVDNTRTRCENAFQFLLQNDQGWCNMFLNIENPKAFPHKLFSSGLNFTRKYEPFVLHSMNFFHRKGNSSLLNFCNMSTY